MSGGAVRDWETSNSGLIFPGATLGHTEAVHPSPGGMRYEDFCRLHVRQSKGRWRGRPLVFYPAQSAFHHELLRTEMGRRIYTEAYYGVPRKNGKSTDVASLALYFLLADGEPAPEVYGAAGSKQQARVVFDEAARMVRASPVLSEWCRVLRNEIIVPSIDGVYRAVSAEGGLQMGTNPSAVVADELHVWKGDAGRELYYALTTGMLARENPIIVSITTAGYERDSIAFELYERMLGAGENPYTDEGRSLMYWIGAGEADDPTDPATWLKANPAPWLTEAVLGREFHRLPLPVFSRLHLNLWTSTEQLWLPPDAWKRLRSDARIKPGERVWVGVDIGFKRDSSAVVMVARRDGEGPGGKPLYIAKSWVFSPAMESDGSLDLSPVENRLKQINVEQDVVEVRYDRTLFQRSAEDLSETMRMVEVPWASNQRVVEMSQALYELIVEKQITHDGDPVLSAHVNAAVIRETESGFRVSKAKSKRHIDALVGLLNAIGGAISNRRIAEPGARFFPAHGRPSGARMRLSQTTADKLAKAAVERVYAGGVVGDITTEEYEGIVRPALHAFAAASVDDGDDLRARIALAEVQRLDSIHLGTVLDEDK
ncbi:MAG: terminase large subunit domain-containing protein [Methyloceanibacter sp.]|uniref:terminase large subunit domain-containing protein n=1 Tax=Methyloceanibacter sp. TaxID=1965321 RepID=UPI003EE108D9